MFVYEAANLLKNVVCPFCKRDTHLGMGSPFRTFNALELNNHCATKECMVFFKDLNSNFNSYENGHIDESELQSWLDHYRPEGI